MGNRKEKRAALMGGTLQLVEKPLFRRIRPSAGGGARGGGSPPRMESNAPEALLCKDSGKRSADFCAAQRRKSNGIFYKLSEKSLDFFDSLERRPELNP